MLHANETPVMVTKDGREGMQKNYMWIYRSESMCEKTRKADASQEFLTGFEGKLKCDRYQVYHTLKTVKILTL